jgi:hypothetical protein
LTQIEWSWGYEKGHWSQKQSEGRIGLVVDMALAKRWNMPWERQTLQFRWEVFNLFNQVRFNALSGLGRQACACIASLQQVPDTFGNYTGLLTQPRVMRRAEIRILKIPAILAPNTRSRIRS